MSKIRGDRAAKEGDGWGFPGPSIFRSMLYVKKCLILGVFKRLFFAVSLDLCSPIATCPCFSVVPKAKYEERLRTVKADMSALKAFEESVNERKALLEETIKNNFHHDEGTYSMPSRGQILY